MTVAQYRYSGTDSQLPRSANVITLVQQNSSSTTNGPTATVTLPSVASGHCMVVLLRYLGPQSSVCTVSDGVSTFTGLTHLSHDFSGTVQNERIFYLLSSNASPGTATFTATLDGASQILIGMYVYDFSSANVFSFDVQPSGGGSFGTGTAATSGSLTTTGTNEVVVALTSTINGRTQSGQAINGSPADNVQAANAASSAFAKVFIGSFTGAATTSIALSDDWMTVAAAFKADTAATAVEDGGWAPYFTVGNAGVVSFGPDAWRGGDTDIPGGQPGILDGGDGNINDITAKLWPVPPSQIPPYIGEQLEWPTPIATFANEDYDVLSQLRVPIPPPLAQRLPWQADQSGEDLPLNTAIDDGGYAPYFTQGAAGTVTVDPSAWQNEDVIPAVQPTAPPTEDWDPFRLMGLPVVVPSPVFPPAWTTLDDTIETPTPSEDWYEPLHYTVILPPVSRLAEWSHINDLVPTQPTAPAIDEPGLNDILLHVKDPVYTIFDRFTFDLDQDYPALVAVIPDIVDSPTRLYVLNFTNNVLYVLDRNGDPMAQPLIITAGETGPLTLALAGANGARQSLLGATVTLRVVGLNETVYANNVALEILNAAQGVVRWTRLSAEVGTPGDYRMQVKAVLSDGTPKWFPDADPNVGNALTILPPV